MAPSDTFTRLIQQQIDADRERRSKNDLPLVERPIGKYTIGDFIRAVLAIDDPTTAQEFYDGLLVHVASQPDLKHTPEHVAKSNIGWCFGEGMRSERIKMWREVTGASHPVFGSMETRPTFDEALRAGVEAARNGLPIDDSYGTIDYPELR